MFNYSLNYPSFLSTNYSWFYSLFYPGNQFLFIPLWHEMASLCADMLLSNYSLIPPWWNVLAPALTTIRPTQMPLISSPVTRRHESAIKSNVFKTMRTGDVEFHCQQTPYIDRDNICQYKCTMTFDRSYESFRHFRIHLHFVAWRHNHVIMHTQWIFVSVLIGQQTTIARIVNKKIETLQAFLYLSQRTAVVETGL